MPLSLSARPVFLDGLLYFRAAGSFQFRPCYPALAGRARKGCQAEKGVAPEEKAGRGVAFASLLLCCRVAFSSFARWQEQRDLHAAAVALGLAPPSAAPPPDAAPQSGRQRRRTQAFAAKVFVFGSRM
jgi:hypothetical protein